MELLYVRIEYHHYFLVQQVFAIPMQEFWFLFNMDEVDISFVTCWTL
jgi:hypothetical protein